MNHDQPLISTVGVPGHLSARYTFHVCPEFFHVQ